MIGSKYPDFPFPSDRIKRGSDEHSIQQSQGQERWPFVPNPIIPWQSKAMHFAVKIHLSPGLELLTVFCVHLCSWSNMEFWLMLEIKLSICIAQFTAIWSLSAAGRFKCKRDRTDAWLDHRVQQDDP